MSFDMPALSTSQSSKRVEYIATFRPMTSRVWVHSTSTLQPAKNTWFTLTHAEISVLKEFALAPSKPQMIRNSQHVSTSFPCINKDTFDQAVACERMEHSTGPVVYPALPMNNRNLSLYHLSPCTASLKAVWVCPTLAMHARVRWPNGLLAYFNLLGSTRQLHWPMNKWDVPKQDPSPNCAQLNWMPSSNAFLSFSDKTTREVLSSRSFASKPKPFCSESLLILQRVQHLHSQSHLFHILLWQGANQHRPEACSNFELFTAPWDQTVSQPKYSKTVHQGDLVDPLADFPTLGFQRKLRILTCRLRLKPASWPNMKEHPTVFGGLQTWEITVIPSLGPWISIGQGCSNIFQTLAQEASHAHIQLQDSKGAGSSSGIRLIATTKRHSLGGRCSWRHYDNRPNTANGNVLKPRLLNWPLRMLSIWG